MSRTPWQRFLRRWQRRIVRALRIAAPEPQPDTLGLLFGYPAIARHLGLTRNQARSLVARRAIPAFLLDGTPCARRDSINRHIARLEAEPTGGH